MPGRALQFVVEYCSYVRELRVRPWVAGWTKGLFDEVMSSRLNQLSLFLGVVGVTGAFAATFSYLIKNPSVPLIAFAVAVFAFVGLTMFDFQQRRRAVAESDGVNMQYLIALLELLLRRNSCSKSEIITDLRIAGDKSETLVKGAIEDGWVEEDGGALKLAEGMRPLARQLIDRTKR